MDDEPPFEYLLDQPAGPAPGAQELQAIVARSGRTRTRITAGAVAVALAVGGGAGWLAASGRSSRGTDLALSRAGDGATVGATTTVVPPRYAAVAGGASAPGPILPGPLVNSLTKSFVRTTADAVTIRGYKPPPGATPLPAGSTTCDFLLPGFHAEVSTADIVGQAWSRFQPPNASGSIEAVSSAALGVAEGAPVWVVITKTPAAVAQVRVTFADGKTDQMTPVDGWAVLAHVAPGKSAEAPAGTVEALDGSGKAVGSKPLPDLGAAPGAPPLPGPPVTGAPGAVPAPPVNGSAAAGAPPIGQMIPTTIPAGPRTQVCALLAPSSKTIPAVAVPGPVPTPPPGTATTAK